MDTQKDKSVEAALLEALLEAGVMSADGGMSIGGYPSIQIYGVNQLFMELRASNIPFEADGASVLKAINEMAKRHDQQQREMHEAGLASVRNQRHLLSRF